ncbi:ABC-type lipoprotein export system ATPase subunit [Rhodoplanes tepidamans]|nr:ABC-type lipoprotein export system ATPase subunit [Rhodoplanes tepidamans]
MFEILCDCARGKTVIAVTHDLDIARRVDRRIALMEGAMVAAGRGGTM